MTSKSVIILIALFLKTFFAFGDDVVYLGKTEQVFLKGEKLCVFEDKSDKISINEILNKEGKSVFFVPSKNQFGNSVRGENTSYWYKIKLKNDSNKNANYIIESFNYRIDSIQFYEVIDGVLRVSDSIGVGYDFGKREIKHKNLTHCIGMAPNEEVLLFIRIKNRYDTHIEIVVRKMNFFTSYALTEYFYLGIFYGSIVVILILNLLAGFFLQSRSHFYYVAYILFVGIFFLSKDGMGFQYLWPNTNMLNDYIYILSIYFMTVFLLLYTESFLNIKFHYPKIAKLFIYYIILRGVILIINFSFFPTVGHLLLIDLIPFFLVYYSSYLSYKNKYPLSIYFLIGTTVLTLGFVVNFLMVFLIIPPGVFVFYVVNVSFFVEMIIFYFALAERMRFYKQHKELAVEQKKVIADKESLIDQFIYKTSHDLSGPIKTILGLTNLALTNEEKSDQRSYIEMIQSTAIRLDEVLKAVAQINIIEVHTLEKTFIDPAILMRSVLDNNKLKPYLSSIMLNVKNKDNEIFREDNYILHSLILNLLKFQLFCLSYEGERKVSIEVEIINGLFIITTSNNGVAIPVEFHKSVFNIFFRMSNSELDLGTFMYTAKLCADKLKAKILIASKDNASVFRVTLPLIS